MEHILIQYQTAEIRFFNYDIPDELADPHKINNYFVSSTQSNDQASQAKILKCHSNLHPNISTIFSLNFITREEIYQT